MRKQFSEQYSHENLALHLYDIFRNLPSMSVENAKDTTSDLTIEEVEKIQLVVNICDGMCFSCDLQCVSVIVPAENTYTEQLSSVCCHKL